MSRYTWVYAFAFGVVSGIAGLDIYDWRYWIVQVAAAVWACAERHAALAECCDLLNKAIPLDRR